MEVYEKLIMQITETKYLSTENSYRYRPIMRCFYRHYEQLEYWLYKEDIYNELCNNEIFKDYTIIECERDLETLVEWMSLSKMQDTKNATSIEEFKNKRFRYQLTEYATEIERLTIILEEMEIKTSSLEPKLFDSIRIILSSLENIGQLDENDVNELWNNLNDDFTKLNQNYQDFLKKFNEPKSEELLQSVLFLQFKSEIIKYLREFIKGYQKNVYHIKSSISKISEDDIADFLEKLISYYKKNPMMDVNFDYLREVNYNKIINMFKWFTGTPSGKSEGEKLMNTTDNIIVKITKYANSLIELRGNMTNRREEYKHLCRLFDDLSDVGEAHKYASVVFGIENVRHFVGNSTISTDSIVNTYDVVPMDIVLGTRSRTRKEKINIMPIVDKSEEKRKLLLDYRKEQEENKRALTNLIKNGKISLNGEVKLSKVERRYIQKLLSSKAKRETEFGLAYKIHKQDGVCKIISEDGIFIISNVDIIFEGGL